MIWLLETNRDGFRRRPRARASRHVRRTDRALEGVRLRDARLPARGRHRGATQVTGSARRRETGSAETEVDHQVHETEAPVILV